MTLFSFLLSQKSQPYSYMNQNLQHITTSHFTQTHTDTRIETSQRNHSANKTKFQFVLATCWFSTSRTRGAIVFVIFFMWHLLQRCSWFVEGESSTSLRRFLWWSRCCICGYVATHVKLEPFVSSHPMHLTMGNSATTLWLRKERRIFGIST